MSYPNYNQGFGSFGQTPYNENPYSQPYNYGPPNPVGAYPTRSPHQYPPAHTPYEQPHRTYPHTRQEGQRSKLRKVFDAWDSDHSGSIDEYELAQVLREMGEDSSPAVVKSIIDNYDLDGNGTIEFNGMLTNFFVELTLLQNSKTFITTFLE